MCTEFIINGNFGGYYDEDGFFVVCEEYGCSDADMGNFDIEVQNGDGFYNQEGKFVRFTDYDLDCIFGTGGSYEYY